MEGGAGEVDRASVLSSYCVIGTPAPSFFCYFCGWRKGEKVFNLILGRPRIFQKDGVSQKSPYGQKFSKLAHTDHLVFFMRSVPILTPTGIKTDNFATILKSYTIPLYDRRKIVVFTPVRYWVPISVTDSSLRNRT